MLTDTLIPYLIMMNLKFERRSEEINEEIIEEQNYWNQYLGRGPQSQKLYRLKPKMGSSDTSVVRIINWQIKLVNTWTRFSTLKNRSGVRLALNDEQHKQALISTAAISRGKMSRGDKWTTWSDLNFKLLSFYFAMITFIISRNRKLQLLKLIIVNL